MSDNGCRDHCPCVGKTWGTIIDTHRATVADARADADRLAEALRGVREGDMDGQPCYCPPTTRPHAPYCEAGRHALRHHDGSDPASANVPLKTPQVSP